MKKKQDNNDNGKEADEQDIPSYEDAEVSSSIEEAHNFTDKILNRDQEDTMDNGHDEIDLPDSYDIAAHKYNIEPDIAREQQHDFNPNRAFFGRHVVNSNTKRIDNFRHLIQMDICDDYDMIPTRRQRANQIRQRVTAEYQACRSNPEIGGFDRKLQRSVLKREDVDVKQTLNSPSKKKKGGLFGLLGGKK